MVWIGSVKSEIFVYTVFEQSLHVHIYILGSMKFFCLFVCSVFGFSFDIKRERDLYLSTNVGMYVDVIDK